MRAGAAAACVLLAACAAGGQQRARVTAHPAIAAFSVQPAALRNGRSGAPVLGIQISGTIHNTGAAPLRCRPAAFLLVGPNGDAITPVSQSCDAPVIAPQQRGEFQATFQALQTAHLQFRFEHPDGTYEAYAVTLPPA